MATLRELATKAVAAGFTGKGIKSVPVETVKPSPRRAKTDILAFDELGKRQQKIIRRMAVQGDMLLFVNAINGTGKTLLVGRGGNRRCDVRRKDAVAINTFQSQRPQAFAALLDAVRSHYL